MEPDSTPDIEALKAKKVAYLEEMWSGLWDEVLEGATPAEQKPLAESVYKRQPRITKIVIPELGLELPAQDWKTGPCNKVDDPTSFDPGLTVWNSTPEAKLEMLKKYPLEELRQLREFVNTAIYDKEREPPR